jgi:molybdenum cofactor guanylyltransferase
VRTNGPSFTGAVLTGGSSTRMGADKALLVVDGRPMAVRAADALRSAGAAEVVAIGGDLEALVALGLDARPDDHPDEGPLGGVISALRLAAHDMVVVLACDMPAVDASVVRPLVEALEADPQADVAAATEGGRVQALTAVYRLRTRAALAEQFAAGERAVRRAIVGLVVVEVDGLDPATLVDVDRPEDLRRYAHPS